MAERRTIVIDPVTRIEGHSKITLHLDEQGRVEDARFHVTQFRGFEKFCEGRPFSEMPALMAPGPAPGHGYRPSTCNIFRSASEETGTSARRYPPSAVRTTDY